MFSTCEKLDWFPPDAAAPNKSNPPLAAVVLATGAAVTPELRNGLDCGLTPN